MTALVIERRPHTLTRYTSDETALPYRGWYAHAPRVYLTGTPVLDVLGRRNGLTHTWLAYECANVGCRYLLLVRAEHAHDLAAHDLHGPPRNLSTAVAFGPSLRDALNATHQPPASIRLYASDPAESLALAGLRRYDPRLNFIPNDSTGSTP